MAQALDFARAARAAPPFSHFPLFIAACYRSLSVRHRVAAKVVVAFQVKIKSVQEQLLTISAPCNRGREGGSKRVYKYRRRIAYRPGRGLYVRAPALCYDAQTYIWTGASH